MKKKDDPQPDDFPKRNPQQEDIRSDFSTKLDWPEPTYKNPVGKLPEFTDLPSVDNFTWDEALANEVLVAGLEGAAEGMFSGLAAGILGAPITAGASLPTCAVAGAMVGYMGAIGAKLTMKVIEMFIE